MPGVAINLVNWVLITSDVQRSSVWRSVASASAERKIFAERERERERLAPEREREYRASSHQI
jgi:hypothetical protein